MFVCKVVLDQSTYEHCHMCTHGSEEMTAVPRFSSWGNIKAVFSVNFSVSKTEENAILKPSVFYKTGSDIKKHGSTSKNSFS